MEVMFDAWSKLHQAGPPVFLATVGEPMLVRAGMPTYSLTSLGGIRDGARGDSLRKSRIPITNNHSVMTVGPMIVKIRDASVGSPTNA